MSVHTASTVVHAPVNQVYQLFSHFNDFPKFMSHIKEVTYYDSERSHWAADVIGPHEWDAVNDSWIEGRQIGWRSTSGLENSGRVNFEPSGDNQTQVTVTIEYNPPAGALGDLGDKLGGGRRFDMALQQDLDHFAEMVNQAPVGALDPNSSNYIFHPESAAARGKTTAMQNTSMENELAEDDELAPSENVGSGF